MSVVNGKPVLAKERTVAYDLDNEAALAQQYTDGMRAGLQAALLEVMRSVRARSQMVDVVADLAIFVCTDGKPIR